ncbi:MAG: rRNA maturation RNase YbeY [Cyanobacteriota bacterium]|nr:rRNA maturation RNase YbeY [Cyanobacteriota bacterium]
MAAPTPAADPSSAEALPPPAPDAAAPQIDLAFQLEPEPTSIAAIAAEATDLILPPMAEARWTDLIREWLRLLAAQLPTELRSPAYSLGLSLVMDAAIAQLNSDWRHASGPTDVLAFAAQEEAPPLPPQLEAAQPLELGDIVISLETAARQAALAGHTLHHELLFLASHGLLHLLGWDHPDATTLAAMVSEQEALLASTAHLLDQTSQLGEVDSPG